MTYGGRTKSTDGELVAVVAKAIPLPTYELQEEVAGGVVEALRAAGYEIRQGIDFDNGE